jgi:citrate lyase subunit beta/citryl-CoA lyase
MIARSYLYVPANNLEMLKKATSRGADALIIDLEDSVAQGEKDQARENLISWLDDLVTSTQIWVRINAEEIDQDLKIIQSRKVHGIVVPKASHSIMSYVSDSVGDRYILSALIETAEGVLDARRIAQITRVEFLQIGVLDLTAELGLARDLNVDTINYALSHLVFASAAAGINPPIAPMYRDFNDLEGLRDSCRGHRANGFFGKSCVHPKQVEIINQEFSYSSEEIADAKAVIEAIESSQGVALDSKGRMIDIASEKHARRIIEGVGEQ